MIIAVTALVLLVVFFGGLYHFARGEKLAVDAAIRLLFALVDTDRGALWVTLWVTLHFSQLIVCATDGQIDVWQMDRAVQYADECNNAELSEWWLLVKFSLQGSIMDFQVFEAAVAKDSTFSATMCRTLDIRTGHEEARTAIRRIENTMDLLKSQKRITLKFIKVSPKHVYSFNHLLSSLCARIFLLRLTRMTLVC